ncbi:MAG: hypothetical protein ACP5L4_06540 [Thermoplasmata archaeon]
MNIEKWLYDLLGNFRLYTTDGVIEELYKMSKTRWEAKASLQLIDKKKIDVIKTGKKGDESLFYASMNENCYILTNDLNLVRRIKETGKNVIIVRGFGRLDFY